MPKVGEWAWCLSKKHYCCSKQLCGGTAFQIAVVPDNPHGQIGVSPCPSHPTQDGLAYNRKNLRPIRVGDKVRIAENPSKSWLETGDVGNILGVSEHEVDLPGAMNHSAIGSPTWATYKDIRLVKEGKDS